MRTSRLRALDLGRPFRQLLDIKFFHFTRWQLFHFYLFDLYPVGIALVQLNRQQTFQRTSGVVVRKLRSDLSVHLVNHMIPFCYDRKFIPLRSVGFHRLLLRNQPANPLRIQHHIFSIEPHDAATFFLVGHSGMFDRRMHIALISGNRPLPKLGNFLTTILDS